jgi:hypothetical protein
MLIRPSVAHSYKHLILRITAVSTELSIGDLLRWPRDTLYPLKLALTSPIKGGRSVGIVRFRTKATEFIFCLCWLEICLYLSSFLHCWLLSPDYLFRGLFSRNCSYYPATLTPNPIITTSIKEIINIGFKKLFQISILRENDDIWRQRDSHWQITYQ